MNYKSSIVFMLFCLSCKTSGNLDNASINPNIKAIVTDYCKHRNYKKFKVFYIDKKITSAKDKNIFGVFPNNVPFIVAIGDTLDKLLPTDYIEVNNKTFFWRDENKIASKNLISYMYHKKLIDSSYIKFQMGLLPEQDVIVHDAVIDETIEGVTYVFCLSDPGKIKKRISSLKYINGDDTSLRINCD